MFWSLVWGGIAGKWIADLTPDDLKPWVAGSILGITVIGMAACKFGWLPKPQKDWVTAAVEGLTIHSKLENTGFTIDTDKSLTPPVIKKLLTIDTDKPLTPPIIKELLTNTISSLPSEVLPHIDLIINSVSRCDLLDKMSAVIIHNNRTVLIMIKKTNADSKQVLSICV